MAAVDKWNERYSGTELVWSGTANTEFVRQVADLRPARALDLGSGEGRNAIWLAQQGWQVCAVDFSDAGISKARQLATKLSPEKIEIEWVVSDACEFEDKAGFDLVAILYLHTTKAERDRWLPKAINMVRPGGAFIYIGHDPENITQGVGGPQIPELLPDASEFGEYLSEFDIVHAGVVRREVQTETGHGAEGPSDIALDCLVKAIRR